MALKEFWASIGRHKTRFIVSGSGRPVVLVHGLGGSLETWKNNFNFLSRHFKVYAFDMLGFGLADKPKIQYRIGVFTDFLEGFLDAISAEKVCLIGNSLGGLVSLWFAVHHQDRLEKLVVESAAGLETGARYVIMDFMGEWWTMESLKRFYQFVYYDPSKVSEEILELRLEMFSSPEAQHAYKSTLNMPREWEILPEKLISLERPTLIVWGAQDKLIPVKHAYQLHKLIKNSKLAVFKETGHIPHAEKPEKFNEMVTGFLKDP
ncbi:TPA: alpha/beta fold hydrolase [Candidatus Bathyarchaeota archaeon]|nr:alpha/beta fold hydrolase [Candidatus Bathyarchaeota archaeon]